MTLVPFAEVHGSMQQKTGATAVAVGGLMVLSP